MDETESSAKQMNNKMRMNDRGAIWAPSVELKHHLRGNLAKARFSVKGGYIHIYMYKKMLMALTLYGYVN